MIGKFGIETNRQQVLLEGNRMCFEEIAAVNGLTRPTPSTTRRQSGSRSGSADDELSDAGAAAAGFVSRAVASVAQSRSPRERAVVPGRRGRRECGRGDRDGNGFAGVVPTQLLKLLSTVSRLVALRASMALSSATSSRIFLRRGVAQADFAIGQDLQDPSQRGRVNARGLIGERSRLGFETSSRPRSPFET